MMQHVVQNKRSVRRTEGETKNWIWFYVNYQTQRQAIHVRGFHGSASKNNGKRLNCPSYFSACTRTSGHTPEI